MWIYLVLAGVQFAAGNPRTGALIVMLGAVVTIANSWLDHDEEEEDESDER